MRLHDGAKHRAVEWLQDPEVIASLQDRRENKDGESWGCPLLLIEGRRVASEEEKKELQALGVSGEILSYADLPTDVRRAAVAAGIAKAGDAAQGVKRISKEDLLKSLK